MIAATNRDLKIEVEENRFREDLYFRLNVFPIEAVPLGQRGDDIPLMAQHFITLTSQKLNRPEPKLTLANVKQLQSYTWPGNIRELQNVIERASIISQNNKMKFDLPGLEQTGLELPGNAPTITQVQHKNGLVEESSGQQPYGEEERLARDRENIRHALAVCKGKISGDNGAARLLGIKPTTLASWIKKLGIEST